MTDQSRFKHNCSTFAGKRKYDTKKLLKPLIHNNIRLLSIKAVANGISHVKDKTNHKNHILREIPKLFDRVFPISAKELAYKHKKIIYCKYQD